MRPRIAALLLRLSAAPDSPAWNRALGAVLREAASGASGAPAAIRAAARAAASHPEAVWRVWLEPSVSGPAPRRWASPLLPALLDGGDTAAVPDLLVDAAWRDWLDDHHPALWSLLERWNQPASPAADPGVRSLSRLVLGDQGAPVAPRLLAGTAARFGHPIGESARARLLAPDAQEAVDLFCAAALDAPDAMAFCLAHRLAPSGDVQRAVFFVRTGQHEQHRALDPEGELLALGYQGATPQERAALRTAMTTLGEIDTLRVVAGQQAGRQGLKHLSDQERAYLVRQLTERRDWDGLWRLTLQMPLAEAVEAAARVSGDWLPPGEDDRGLFQALRTADPRAVRDQVAALSSPVSRLTPQTRISLRDLGLGAWLTFIDDLDFAPDGTQLAFAGGHVNGGERVYGGVGIMDIASRAVSLSRVHSGLEHRVRQVRHLGADTVVALDVARKLHLCAGPEGRSYRSDRPRMVEVVRIAGDRAFLACSYRDGMTNFFIGTAGMDLVRSGMLDAWASSSLPRVPSMATDPDGRTVAILRNERTMIADLSSSTVKELRFPGSWPGPSPIAAMSPSILLACCGTDLHVLHEPLTSAQAPQASEAVFAGTLDVRPTRLAWSPALRQFLALNGEHLTVLRVPPTRDSPRPESVVRGRITLGRTPWEHDPVCLSPRGDVLAVAPRVEGTIDLYLLTALSLRHVIGKPLSQKTHRHLADVVAVQEHPVCGDASRETLELLRTCLEHRFRHDVVIGDTTSAVPTADDDIELGATGSDDGAQPG
ncbi:hypothetical protein [Streptomyces sp. 6N223]|uniref:hypothetical protein n=1 Tax=Streptomyces sp. 6N223 TaxID=3457412 RepID=UPI003FD476AA